MNGTIRTTVKIASGVKASFMNFFVDLAFDITASFSFN